MVTLNFIRIYTNRMHKKHDEFPQVNSRPGNDSNSFSELTR